MSYVLVLFLYAGTFNRGNSIAITNIPGFKSEASCVAAGKAGVDLAKSALKEGRFVCLKQE
jgi:hypothetical protein